MNEESPTESAIELKQHSGGEALQRTRDFIRRVLAVANAEVDETAKRLIR
jgi:hypothetical protein